VFRMVNYFLTAVTFIEEELADDGKD